MWLPILILLTTHIALPAFFAGWLWRPVPRDRAEWAVRAACGAFLVRNSVGRVD